MPGHARLDRSDPPGMPHLILGHRLDVPVHSYEVRGGGDPEQGLKFLLGRCGEGRIVAIQEVLGVRPSEERPEQHRPIRSPAGVFEARERAGKDLPPFRVRHHEPKPVERLVDLRPTVRQGDERRRRVGNRRERAAEVRIPPRRQPGRARRGDRKDHPIGGHRGPVGQGHPPGTRTARPRDRRDPLTESHRRGREPAGHGRDQVPHSAGQGDEQAPSRTALRRGAAPIPRPPERADDAPVPPFHLRELRHRRREADGEGVRGIDRAHEGLDHPVEQFAPEPPGHERPHAFVFARPAFGQDEVHREAQPAPPGEEGGSQNRSEAARGKDQESVGQRHQAAAADDEGPAGARLRGDQPTAEPQSVTEGTPPGLLRQKRCARQARSWSQLSNG